MGCQNPKHIQVLITGGHGDHALHVQASRLSAHALTAKLHCKQSPLSVAHYIALLVTSAVPEICPQFASGQ